MFDSVVAGIIIGVLAMVAGRLMPALPWRRTLGRCLAVVALWLATMAERLLTDGKPAKLDVSRLPGPAIQEVAMWVGNDWQLIELSLN